MFWEGFFFLEGGHVFQEGEYLVYVLGRCVFFVCFGKANIFQEGEHFVYASGRCAFSVFWGKPNVIQILEESEYCVRVSGSRAFSVCLRNVYVV